MYIANCNAAHGKSISCQIILLCLPCQDFILHVCYSVACPASPAVITQYKEAVSRATKATLTPHSYFRSSRLAKKTHWTTSTVFSCLLHGLAKPLNVTELSSEKGNTVALRNTRYSILRGPGNVPDWAVRRSFPSAPISTSSAGCLEWCAFQYPALKTF